MDNLEKYRKMMSIHDSDRELFFSMVYNDVTKYMPQIYTPCVGDACKNFSKLYNGKKGLYITLNDLGKVNEKIKQFKNVKVTVITDGERILGLGDLGADGMGISIGKLHLYTVCGGIHPDNVLPITVDVGTNNEEKLNDPVYTGLKHKRCDQPRFNQLMNELINSLTNNFPDILIQFEDFGNHNAFYLLDEYRNKVCCFNDDIQGTAAVVVSGLITACSVKKTELHDETYLFLGAGEAGVGIADLLVKQMVSEGVKESDAIKKCILIDHTGLVTTDRENLPPHKARYAYHSNDSKKSLLKDLLEIIDHIRPTALIGVSTAGGAFTKDVIMKMAELNERPIIFPLSNPTDHSECTAEEAFTYTNGKVLFASGSPFDPVTIGEKTYVPGQGNNAYIFPGLGLGITLGKIKTVTDEIFLTAAHTLSHMVTKDDLKKGLLYPPLNHIRSVSMKIAENVIRKHGDYTGDSVCQFVLNNVYIPQIV